MATIGVCVFYAFTSVDAFFIIGVFMRKKVTNDDVGNAIGKIAEKIRDDMDYEFRVAESQMWIAENDLVDSLNESQYALYRDYCEKRNAFFKLAKELYERKF